MQSNEIRSRFLAFFEKRGHKIIESASLVTSDEKGITNPTLFNTAGMQPLIPFLLGKPHPDGKRLVDVQKCLRTVDIDDVGDATHATFFEMLGNWSLGDYFKDKAIQWSFELLTNGDDKPEGDKGFDLDPNRLYVTVFEGDDNAPRDYEAVSLWQKAFGNYDKRKIDIGGDTSKGEKGRIFYLPADKNWWQAGDNGPCGPDTEMYYDVKNRFGGRTITLEEFKDADDKRDIVEVWNDVFMQYEKKDGKIIGTLPAPSVDTGAGLERLAMVMQGVDNIYDTDLLKPVFEFTKSKSNKYDERSARIIADHIRASVFLISDGVIPSNTDRGYVLRKLIRRAVRLADKLGFNDEEILINASMKVCQIYGDLYIKLNELKFAIISQIRDEENRFRETLRQGLKEFEKGTDAFTLFSSFGFPLELTLELAKEKGIEVNVDEFNRKFEEHQALSRSGAEQKFKGGLADANDPMIVRYHTATHLLHQALHDVLGENVMQKGSNITAERLRFDFAHGAKMTDDEKKKVEEIVNEKIEAKLPVNKVVMSKVEAEKTGARHFFGEKYGDEVSIYYIGDNIEHAYSKEFCGGPHVSNTGELAGEEGKSRFKIAKEEAVAQGVRRIKAVLA